MGGAMSTDLRPHARAEEAVVARDALLLGLQGGALQAERRRLRRSFRVSRGELCFGSTGECALDRLCQVRGCCQELLGLFRAKWLSHLLREHEGCNT